MEKTLICIIHFQQKCDDQYNKLPKHHLKLLVMVAGIEVVYETKHKRMYDTILFLTSQ